MSAHVDAIASGMATTVLPSGAVNVTSIVFDVASLRSPVPGDAYRTEPDHVPLSSATSVTSNRVWGVDTSGKFVVSADANQ